MRETSLTIENIMSFISRDLDGMKMILDVHKVKFIILSGCSMLLSVVPSIFIVFSIGHYSMISYFILFIALLLFIPLLMIPTIALLYYGISSRLSNLYSWAIITLIIASYTYWISYFFYHGPFH